MNRTIERSFDSELVSVEAYIRVILLALDKIWLTRHNDGVTLSYLNTQSIRTEQFPRVQAEIILPPAPGERQDSSFIIFSCLFINDGSLFDSSACLGKKSRSVIE